MKTRLLNKRFSVVFRSACVQSSIFAIALTLRTAAGDSRAAEASLVPTQPNTSPDYVCTWNTQNYYVSYAPKPANKEAVNESTLFGKGKYQNWLGQFEKLHGDFFFLLDEGWDLPEEHIEIVANRFPSYATGSQPDDFAHLVKDVKARGWRGLGLWARSDKKTDGFWTERLDWMNKSAVSYWKIDYGNDGRDEVWRKHLTDMGREHAPDLIIEAAMTPHNITWADTYRTYDVDPILAIPQTLGRIAQLLDFKAVPPAKGLINSEDELYIGATLGCCYGVMRHEFSGNLPNGRQDFAFPPVNRDLKKCLDEVTRAVHWHRIAPAFAVGANEAAIDSNKLKDNWFYQKDESWQKNNGAGKSASEEAPARIARGLPLPEVALHSGTVAPYVLASRNPNGAIAVGTVGRTICASAADRKWITGENADVKLQIGQNTGPIGIFGRFHSLKLVFDDGVVLKGANQGSPVKIIAQDLAGEIPEDITNAVHVSGNELEIPGDVIDRIGLSGATKGDKSQPGLVLVIR